MALKAPKFEVFEGKDGKWYWRVLARNNKSIARCSEDGYRTQFEARRAAKATQAAFAAVVIQ